MSMRNPHTVLVQKQIEQIHSNRLDAIARKLRVSTSHPPLGEHHSATFKPHEKNTKPTKIQFLEPAPMSNKLQVLQIQKNHLEAKARRARLMSMRNSHTVLTQKQIEHIHSNRMDAIARKLKVATSHPALWKPDEKNTKPSELQFLEPTPKSKKLQVLQIQKNHVEAKARRARLISMRNPHTILTHKQIEHIHRNRMMAIARKLKVATSRSTFGENRNTMFQTSREKHKTIRISLP